MAAPMMMRFEAVGRWYESRVSHVTGADSGTSVGDSSSDEEDCSGAGDVEDGTSPGDLNPFLLDPTQWKVRRIVHDQALRSHISLFQPEAKCAILKKKDYIGPGSEARNFNSIVGNN